MISEKGYSVNQQQSKKSFENAKTSIQPTTLQNSRK
jgi:hypothetical protein